MGQDWPRFCTSIKGTLKALREASALLTFHKSSLPPAVMQWLSYFASGSVSFFMPRLFSLRFGPSWQYLELMLLLRWHGTSLYSALSPTWFLALSGLQPWIVTGWCTCDHRSWLLSSSPRERGMSFSFDRGGEKRWSLPGCCCCSLMYKIALCFKLVFSLHCLCNNVNARNHLAFKAEWSGLIYVRTL
jgi:hypothetical protein